MDLTLGVTMAVLAAGFLHAGWNALLKSSDGGDVLLDTAAVVAGSSVCGLALLAFVPLPDPAAWKFIAASATIHFGYYLTLVQAYRTGDLSFAYPLMRGTAPLIVTVLGSIFLRELPSVQMTAGILLISIGIVSIGSAGLLAAVALVIVVVAETAPRRRRARVPEARLARGLGRRRVQPCRLWHRALGDDAGADRRGSGAA